jgi:nucleotide-binding universal stress UspA family protein
MIAVRRILVPCDFSDFSRRALDHAAALSHWFGAEVTVLYALPLVSTLDALPIAVGPVPVAPVSKDAIHEELVRFTAPVAEKGLRCDIVVAEGGPVDQILGHATNLPADLLVMGTHGRSGFERWVLGSVTEKVLRKAPCPVLTVPKDAVSAPVTSRPPFRRVLCALDFSSSSLKALEYAMTLAQQDYAEITLLHVLEALPDFRLEAQGFDVARYRATLEADTLERLRHAVPEGARDWCKPEATVAHGKAHEEILRVAEERKSDLIVMGVHGRKALDIMVFGSNTHHVIRGARCPVLTIRG